MIDSIRSSLPKDALVGGAVAENHDLEQALADMIAAGPQADVIIASSFSDDALEILHTRRKATRLLSAPDPEPLGLSVRTFGHTALVQGADELEAEMSTWRCVTVAQPTPAQLVDLALAWRVCARTTSNAIVLAKDGVAVGVGAGQQSRVVAAGIATAKAGEKAVGSAAASDAFFPFRDGLDVVTGNGAAAVIQPGGSVRDDEVIAAADERGIAMVFTAHRHFRH